MSCGGWVEGEGVNGFVEGGAVWKVRAGLADALPAGTFVEGDRGLEVQVHVEDGPQVAGLSVGGRGGEKPSACSLPALLRRYQQAGNHTDSLSCDVETVAGDHHHRLGCGRVQGDVTHDGVVNLGDPGAEGVGVTEEGPGPIDQVSRVPVVQMGGPNQPLAGCYVVISSVPDNEIPTADGLAHAAIPFLGCSCLAG
jgi:hypothetical protein